MVIAYHGSNEKFSRFKFDASVNTHGNSDGFGLYFATDIETAQLYGKYIYEVQLNIRKLISRTRITLKRPVIERLLDVLSVGGQQLDYYWNFQTKQKAFDSFRYCKNDVDVINNIVSVIGNSKDVLAELSKMGYSHTIQSDNFKDGDVHYIMFDPKDIKIIKVLDNK